MELPQCPQRQAKTDSAPRSSQRKLCRLAGLFATGASLLLVGCNQAARTTGTDQRAEGTITRSVVLNSPIDVVNWTNGHKIVSLSELHANGGADGLTLKLPASLVNPGLQLSSTEPIEIKIPQTAIAMENVDVDVLASLIVTDSTIVGSPLNVGNYGDGTEIEHAGKLHAELNEKVTAFASGTTADGEPVGGVLVPKRNVHSTRAEAARTAGVNGIVAEVDVADMNSQVHEVVRRYLSIPRQ